MKSWATMNEGQGKPSRSSNGRPRIPPINRKETGRVLDRVQMSLRSQKPQTTQGSQWDVQRNPKHSSILERENLILNQVMTLNRSIKKKVRRREKVPLPAPKGPGTKRNLGSSFFSRSNISDYVLHYTLYNFKSRLKKKDDRTYAMMTRLSSLIVGVHFETKYVYHGAQLYCSSGHGCARIDSKPNFWHTRLFIEQILQCRTNANKKLIARIINS